MGRLKPLSLVADLIRHVEFELIIALDTGQLVTKGDIFDIAPTDLGDNLVQNYISQKVKVEGTVREGEELKIITVRSFQTVDE